MRIVTGEISERAGGATIQMVGRLGGNSQVCLAGVKTLNFGAGGLIFHLRGELSPAAGVLVNVRVQVVVERV